MAKIEVQFFEDIADEVRRVDAAMAQITNSGLSEKAILVLVSRLSGKPRLLFNA